MVSETTKRNDRLQRRLRKDHGSKCEKRGCSRTRNLEWAHVHPTKLSGNSGRGRSARLADVQSHPKSYQLRCPEHNPRTGPKRRKR